MQQAMGNITVTNIGTIPKRCGRFLLLPGVPIEVPPSFIGEYGYDNQIEFDFSQYQHLMEARNQKGDLNFDFWCPLSMVDGYGRHAIDIYRGMQMPGAEPNLRDVGWVAQNAYLSSTIRAEALLAHTKLPRRLGGCMSVPYHVHIS